MKTINFEVSNAMLELAREFIVSLDPPRTLDERVELATVCAAFGDFLDIKNRVRHCSCGDREHPCVEHPEGRGVI